MNNEIEKYCGTILSKSDEKSCRSHHVAFTLYMEKQLIQSLMEVLLLIKIQVTSKREHGPANMVCVLDRAQ